MVYTVGAFGNAFINPQRGNVKLGIRFQYDASAEKVRTNLNVLKDTT